eukprot:590290-Rhodomonas_salina.1
MSASAMQATSALPATLTAARPATASRFCAFERAAGGSGVLEGVWAVGWVDCGAVVWCVCGAVGMLTQESVSWQWAHTRKGLEKVRNEPCCPAWGLAGAY